MLRQSTPEEWRPVVGYEGWYEVSNLGRVRRIARDPGARTGHVLVPRIRRDGYPFVTLYTGTHASGRMFVVHRLVGAAFLPPRVDAPEINHKDGTRLNARADNLEWVTRGENNLHAYRTGLRSSVWPRSITEIAVIMIRQLRGTEPQSVTARRFGINQSQVSRIQSGKRRPHT
jgi:hypothetical protein